MALDTSFFDTDIAHVLGQIGTSFVYDSETYTGAKTVLNFEQLYADEGLRDSYRFSLNVAAADFDTLPEPNETITIGSTTYVILARQDKTLGRMIRLDLGEDDL